MSNAGRLSGGAVEQTIEHETHRQDWRHLGVLYINTWCSWFYGLARALPGPSKNGGQQQWWSILSTRTLRAVSAEG